MKQVFILDFDDLSGTALMTILEGFMADGYTVKEFEEYREQMKFIKEENGWFVANPLPYDVYPIKGTLEGFLNTTIGDIENEFEKRRVKKIILEHLENGGGYLPELKNYYYYDVLNENGVIVITS
jgi:hypothetical protein